MSKKFIPQQKKKPSADPLVDTRRKIVEVILLNSVD